MEDERIKGVGKRERAVALAASFDCCFWNLDGG
jgi:hypothetical protein